MDLESFQFQFRNKLKEIPKICLIGIRGYTNQEGNPLEAIYDDAIVSCVDGQVKIFTASVDPGSYYINHPMNPMGCAKLQCGLWTYAIGEHHANKALVQADEVRVDRIDKTGKRVAEESGWIGLNIHSGGPEYLVGRFSAGCQVIKSDEPWKDQWLEFFTPILTGCSLFGQRKIPYLLVDKLEAIPEPSLTL